MSAITVEVTDGGVALQVTQDAFAVHLTQEALTPDPISLVVISGKPKLQLQIWAKNASLPRNVPATNECVDGTRGAPMDLDPPQRSGSSTQLRPEPLCTQQDEGNHNIQNAAAAAAATVHVGGDAPRSFTATQGNGTVSFWV